MTLLSDLQVRDPFLVTCHEDHLYRLYVANTEKRSVDCWRSSDLEHFEGPYPVFRIIPGFSHEDATQIWAPEVHFFEGKWYLFVTMGKEQYLMRSTWIFRAESPEGPFLRFTDAPVTPKEWMCLDGTLHVDKLGNPHLVFCHEWVQISNGEICAQPLKPDLSGPSGRPRLLFCGSEAAWIPATRWDEKTVCASSGFPRFITDGPFLWHGARSGNLFMIWSTLDEQNGQTYTLGLAKSSNEDLYGEWCQCKTPLVNTDGGHGMLFRNFSGQLLLAFHQPNKGAVQRVHFLPMPEM